jgi:NIPSNAP
VIYEFSVDTLRPGTVSAYLRETETVGLPARGTDYGLNRGYWVSDFGTLNQVSHLWSYQNHDDRQRSQKKLEANDSWNEYRATVRPWIVRQNIQLLNPLIDLKPPVEGGGFYELRTYTTQAGMATEWASLFQAYLSAREAKIVSLWTSEVPTPHQVVHLWHHRDFASRAAERTAIVNDPVTKEFFANATPLLVDMQSTLLLPTSFSPLN